METIVYAVVGAVVIAALVAQELRRQRVAKALVIEAPVVQRRLIVTALLSSVAALLAVSAAMAAMVEEWSMALILAGVSAGLVIALRLTRKPLAVVRFDGGEHVLSVTSGADTARIELRQPFQLRADLKVPFLPRRETPWMVVTLEQGAQRVSFCFPWSLRELGTGTSPRTQTNEPLPFLLLDWRGAVIHDRLRKIVAAA